MEINAATIAAVLYAGVLASLVAYLCYARSVEIIGANRTGVFIHLIPLFTSVTGDGVCSANSRRSITRRVSG